MVAIHTEAKDTPKTNSKKTCWSSPNPAPARFEFANEQGCMGGGGEMHITGLHARTCIQHHLGTAAHVCAVYVAKQQAISHIRSMAYTLKTGICGYKGEGK